MMVKYTKQLLGYTVISIALITWSIHDSLLKSYNQLMFLTELTSGIKLVILIYFIVMCFICLIGSLLFALFGKLRDIEVENLYETLTSLGIKQLLNVAFSTFDVIISVVFPCLTMGLASIQSILSARLNFLTINIGQLMEVNAMSKKMIIFRILVNLNLWIILGLLSLNFVLAKLLMSEFISDDEVNLYPLFAFQFATYGIDCLTFLSRLMVSAYELLFYLQVENSEFSLEDFSEEQEHESWEYKPYFTKGTEILSGVLKCVTYFYFCYYLMFFRHENIPLTIIQGIYTSFTSVMKEFLQLLSFIKASKRLHTLLPDATNQDLEKTDKLCIICREDMSTPESYESTCGRKLSLKKHPKKLHCNHVLHIGCLKEWLERSEACPLCRRKVFEFETQTTTTVAPVILQDNLSPTNSQNVPAIASGVQENNTTSQARFADYEGMVNRGSENQDGTELSNLNSGENHYQIIKLPVNTLIPPGWTLLPLQKCPDSTYKLSLSQNVQGKVLTRENPTRKDLIMYQAPYNIHDR